MPRFTYTGPSYNPSVGIAIEGTQDLGSWDGITTDDIGGDAIFLRTMSVYYLIPSSMSDEDIALFLIQNPQYASWWIDSGTESSDDLFAPFHLYSDLLASEFIYFKKPNGTRGRITFEELRKFMHTLQNENGEQRRLTMINSFNILLKNITN